MDVSGIVLAGGMSRRLGRTKAIETVGGERLIQRVLQRLSEVAGEMLVVVADAGQAAAFDLPDEVRAVVDVYPGGGSLGGIFSGLDSVSQEWGVVAACDMPFVNIDLVRYMLSLRDDADVVVPMLDGRPEPTHAAYSRSCLGPMERSLKDGDLRIVSFFDDVRVRYVSQDEVDTFDQSLDGRALGLPCTDTL